MNERTFQRAEKRKTSLYLSKPTLTDLRDMSIKIGKPQSWIMEQAVALYKNSLNTTSLKTQ